MPPERAQHPIKREIIEISDESDDDVHDTVLQSPPNELTRCDNRVQAPLAQNTGPAAYESCLQAILALFPDISHDHVRQLFDELTDGALLDSDALVTTIVDVILDGDAYPKEKDRLRELKKRKRDSPEAEAAKWRRADRRGHAEEYARVAKALLLEHFRWVPNKFINETFDEHAHYYGAFFAIDEAERQHNRSSINRPFRRLKSKRVPLLNIERLQNLYEAEGYDLKGLKMEMRNAEERWQKEEKSREAEEERRNAKIASDKEYRRNGETMECACCFSDDIPPTDITHCDADTPHFFCFECAKRNADSDMTSLKYSLNCMDQSRCEASFSREQRARFLDAATIEKLERLQQQDDIRRAELGDLVSCPFCDYAAICPPVDIDRIFECQNADCMEASCRVCKQKSHIPLSCDESKKETGISERHAVEEARTEALVRDCQKCKVRILKDEGCNKIICTSCGSCICDHCGEDISKTRYEHFSSDIRRGYPGGKGKCPLYESVNRKEERIDKAGQDAMDKVRKDNPNLSEEDLKIEFAKVVQDEPGIRRDAADNLHEEIVRRRVPADRLERIEHLLRIGRRRDPQGIGAPRLHYPPLPGDILNQPPLPPPAPPAIPMPPVHNVVPPPGHHIPPPPGHHVPLQPDHWPFNYRPLPTVPAVAVHQPFPLAMEALPDPALFNAGYLRNGVLNPDQEAWARQTGYQPHPFNFGQFNPPPQPADLHRPQPPPAARQPAIQRAQAFNEIDAGLEVINRQMDGDLGARRRQLDAELGARRRQLDAELEALRLQMRESRARRAQPP